MRRSSRRTSAPRSFSPTKEAARPQRGSPTQRGASSPSPSPRRSASLTDAAQAAALARWQATIFASLFIGYFLYTAALYHIPCTIMLWSGMSLVLAIALGVGALAGLIFMCIFEKSYLILATASAGASAATPLIAILIGHIPAAGATAILADARFKYAKAITQLVLFIIGLIVQCRLTRKRCAYGDKKRI